MQQQQQRRSRANAPMRPSAPDWSKLLKAQGGASQGHTTAATSPTFDDGDAEASRPISRASSSYFLGAASRRSSATSLNKLGEQPTWHTSDIEEFLQRRSTDADSSNADSRRASISREFERWALTSRAHTSYQLPLFTLPADSRSLQPRPSSSYQAGAPQRKEEVVAQLRALQAAAAELLREREEGEQCEEGPAAAEEQEEEQQRRQRHGGASAVAVEPSAAAAAAAAGAAHQQQQHQQQQANAPPPATHAPSAAAAAAGAAAGTPAAATPRHGSLALLPPASPAASPFATPGKAPGSARRGAALAAAKPAGSHAYGCITTPSSAVVSRQTGAGGSAAAKAGGKAPAASPGVGSITEHLQQLKLLQQQAEKLFA
jgi:hypothetical protein